MTYRELLELYKKNELEDTKKAQVEADIERQEAINDYLYEQAELPEIEAFLGNDYSTAKDDKHVPTQEQGFLRMVRRSIRKAFLKMGMVIGAVVLIIALFVQFALPKLVATFYYNPGKEIGKDTNQISLDLSVYSELFMPGYIRDNVAVEDRGYGNYDICIYQNVSYNSTFTNVAGYIEQGRLKLYDINALREPVGNAFAWCQAYGDLSKPLTELTTGGYSNFCAAGYPSDAAAFLQKLEDNTKYVAYVTLDRMMSYEDFMKFIHEREELFGVWCAIRTNVEKDVTDEMFRAENMGFLCTNSKSTMLHWNKEKYPSLILWESEPINEKDIEELEQNMQKETFMRKHFIDMLRYMSEQKEFLSLMKRETETFNDAADYVERNGLTVYGFTTIANKAMLLELNASKEVYEIYTQPLK